LGPTNWNDCAARAMGAIGVNTKLNRATTTVQMLRYMATSSERDPFLVLFGSEDLAVVLDAEFDADKAASRAIAVAAVGVS
jgi:hypothetical protein